MSGEGEALQTEELDEYQHEPGWNQESGMSKVNNHLSQSQSFLSESFYIKISASFISGLQLKKLNVSIKSHDFTYLLLMVYTQK